MDDELRNWPFGAMYVANKAFRFSLTRMGACVVILLGVAFSFWTHPKAPPALHAAIGVVYSIPIWFGLFLVSICAALGDALASMVMDKILEKISLPPAVAAVLYFFLSISGFVVAAMFVGFGDDPVERYYDSLGQ
jgi:hypothetical protein